MRLNVLRREVASQRRLAHVMLDQLDTVRAAPHQLPLPSVILNSRTATPRPAVRFSSSRSWMSHPAASRALSISTRACCSGRPGLNEIPL